MKNPFSVLLIIIFLFLIGWFVYSRDPEGVTTPPQDTPSGTAEEQVTYTPASASDMIRIISPQPGDVITSPLTITGEARGGWFFEASFPVILTDWDGRIIAEVPAQAQGEWMTSDFVPFTATLTFNQPENIGDFSRRGSLILKRDNPSGLPENDAAAEMTVYFR